MTETLVYMVDVETGDEVEGISWPYCNIVPRAGEVVHWWQDGFPHAAGTSGPPSRDFEVVSVVHDWRYLPQGTEKTVTVVVLKVREITAAENRNG